ncbi:GvpL/GvpF family gas vesicle protein [Streptomyces sp. NPDC048330]|uniref:GvpL/GvpF family gas vesicle protein n=1 Tax=Streptomyces sp. NPDC048330 TaxID=3365533 RepID=UPI0037168CF8
MNGEPALTYVYAVAAGTSPLRASLAGLRGVGDAPVGILDPGGPDATAPVFVVSQVPAGQWREEALRSRFEDLAWLEDTARAHHDVIQALTAHTNVLPLRLATLYENDDRAREALRAQQDIFSARLAFLAHHTEYGVKVYVAADTSDDLPAEPGAQPDLPSPGKAYLRARRAHHHAREDRYQRARQAAERIAEAAALHAAHAVRHPTQSGPLTHGENGENVLNDAYLVPDENAGAFRAALADAGRGLPGIRIEVTGPWAPYSFAMPPTAQPAAPAADPESGHDRGRT